MDWGAVSVQEKGGKRGLIEKKRQNPYHHPKDIKSKPVRKNIKIREVLKRKRCIGRGGGDHVLPAGSMHHVTQSGKT